MFPDQFSIDGRSFRREEIAQLSQEAAGDPSIPAWKREVYAFMVQFLDGRGGAIVQETSGSTGDPKQHLLEREKMILSARRTLQHLRPGPGSRSLLCLPVRYIAGKMMVVRALVGGMDLLLAEPSGRPLKGIRDRIGLCAMVPLQLHETLSHGDDLSLLDLLLIGGGELRTGTRARLARMERPRIYESFGMTETYTHFALKRINGENPDAFFRLLEGASIRQDRRGCLVVSVRGITAGEIITNDLVEPAARGTGFRWLGRADNVINTGGIKIIPEVLEERITEWLGHPTLLLPESHEKLGQSVVLMVEYSGPEPPVAAWDRMLRERLSPFEVPKRIVPVGELPRNAAMKPDRIRARKLL